MEADKKKIQYLCNHNKKYDLPDITKIKNNHVYKLVIYLKSIIQRKIFRWVNFITFVIKIWCNCYNKVFDWALKKFIKKLILEKESLFFIWTLSEKEFVAGESKKS